MIDLVARGDDEKLDASTIKTLLLLASKKELSGKRGRSRSRNHSKRKSMREG